MPKLNSHETRRSIKPINNTELFNSIPTKFQGENDSTKIYEWELVESFPNSKLKYKIPKDVKVDWTEKKFNNHQGLFNIDISYSNNLFNFDDIRRECGKHFTDSKILDIINSKEKLDEFIDWCMKCKEEEARGERGGLHNSTAHAAYIYDINYPTNDIYVKETVLPPKRKLVNELKKYLTIYSLNRIPCITEHIQKVGIITLYQSDGKETDTIRNTAFNFYNIIMEQAEYLRVIPPRDGRRVYVVGTCDFKK